MDLATVEAKVKALVTDVEAIYRKVEEALTAHNAGNLNPGHLEAVRDSAQAAKENAQALIADPQGSPTTDGPTPTGAVPDAAPVSDSSATTDQSDGGAPE